MDNSAQPLFRQIAVLIEDAVIDGTLAEGAQAPSTNELAAFHNINPATARKGLTLLVDLGILEKRRGIGMFVTSGAAELIRARRRHRHYPASTAQPGAHSTVQLAGARLAHRVGDGTHSRPS